jgi:hypothetical protein
VKIRLSDLWRWDGGIDRGPYALIGVVGFALKHNLDRLVASLVFNRPWGIFNYWIPPGEMVRITSLSPQDVRFFATLVAMALPFIWIGVALTMRRLRAIGLPVWLAVLFFAPALNLLFFLLLSVLPSKPGVASAAFPVRPSSRFLDRLMPDSPAGSAAATVLLTVPLGTAATIFGTFFFPSYGWGLFVALPFCLGLGSVLLYSYHGPRSFASCLVVSLLSTVLLGAGLVLLALEGIVCLVMALPIALPLTMMGGVVGYLIQRRPVVMQSAPSTLAVLILFIPGVMGTERARQVEAPTLIVRTAIEIEAPPERVWNDVVAFAEIPDPTETIFRIGIAYPKRASIAGQGPGAVRRCEFSTGAFVEPIEVWDAPRRLKFSVTVNPAPLEEWTPYGSVHPSHLDGFLVSRGGQFLLTALPGGKTRLEGTTWYQHHMWPAEYWQLWSDAIIHRIHLRVLKQIKRLAEANARSAASR